MLAIAALLAGGFTIMGHSQSAQADEVRAQPGELVINGGGEQPVTVGWQGPLGRATHGASGYPPSNIVNSTGLTGQTFPGGASLLTGSGASSVATQTIDLTPSAAAIDNRNVDALLSVYIGGYAGQQDQARVTYSFYDAAGNNLAETAFGPVTAADRGGVSGFVPFADSIRLPASVRSAVITISTQRFTAPANDAYIDNVSLVLEAPSPTALPDTATTLQGVAVSLAPPTNDEPGAGAQIVPESLRLLDGVTEVTTLTTSDGVYTVDTATGGVLFTPTAGFIGMTAAVPYRITDSSGQRADATIRIDVAAPAPGLTVVKTASPVGREEYVVGTVVTYSFLVTNTGNVRVDGLVVSEDVFTGSGGVPEATCPATSIDPGAQLTCTAVYILTQADIDNSGVSNTASVSGTASGFEIPVESGPSSFTIPVDPAPALSLKKTVDAGDATAAGDDIDYSFAVTNTGNVTISRIAVNETVFSGTGEVPDVSCPAGQVVPGAVVTCTASYELTQDDVDAGGVTNTAVAGAMVGDAEVWSEPSSAVVEITARPALSLLKTASTESVSTAGDVVHYTFRVTNSGNITLSDIAINDFAFTGAGQLTDIICPAADLSPGNAVECTSSYEVMQADLGAASISNSATASTTAGNAQLESDASTAVVAVAPPAEHPANGGEDESPVVKPGTTALPATGGGTSWQVVAGCLFTLAIGGALLLGARRRNAIGPATSPGVKVHGHRSDLRPRS